MVMNNQRTDKHITVWGAVPFGQRRIMHSINKDLKDLTRSLVVINIPNISRHEVLLIVTKGEHTGTFMHWITHEGTGEDCLAVCRVVMWRKGFLDEVTTMTLKLRAEDLASVAETKEERRLNHNVLRGEWNAVRQC